MIGTSFKISIEKEGDVGFYLDVNASGQFTYTTSNLANHVSSIVKFKASTIDI